MKIDFLSTIVFEQTWQEIQIEITKPDDKD